MHKILLVENDIDIVKLLNLHFSAAQYDLTCCNESRQAMEKVAVSEYDLVILDIELPDGNGLEICKYIRQKKIGTPVIMLTCHSEEAEKVLALELGADDYVTKPFGILELMARVKAVIRRSTQNQPTEMPAKNDIVFKDLVIDTDKRKATLLGKRIDLTVKEFNLLCLLAGSPGKTFTRKQLLQDIWGYAFEGYEHTITSHINRLRLKLESDLNNPAYILTAWGSGYRFAE